MDGPAPSSEGKTSAGSPQDKGGKAPRAAFSSAYLYSAAPRQVSPSRPTILTDRISPGSKASTGTRTGV